MFLLKIGDIKMGCIKNICSKYESNENFEKPESLLKVEDNWDLCTATCFSASFVALCIIDNAHNALMVSDQCKGMKIAGVVTLATAALEVFVLAHIEAIARALIIYPLALIFQRMRPESVRDTFSDEVCQSLLFTCLQVFSSLHTAYQVVVSNKTIKNLYRDRPNWG